MEEAKRVTTEKYLDLLVFGRPTAAYRAAVRENIVVFRSLEFHGVDCENVIYNVFSRPPSESFFCDADPESVKITKEITRERQLGDVETGIYTIEDYLGRQCSHAENDHSSKIYKQVRDKGVEEGDKVATIRGFYPLRDLGVKSGIPSKFKCRGVGGHVLGHVIHDLGQKGAKGVFITFPSEDIKPLLEKHGFERLTDQYYFKLI